MHRDKQTLLKKHRRQKRIGVFLLLIFLLALGFSLGWLWSALLLLLAWVAHEAWLADHLFYSPKWDYQYQFPENSQRYTVKLIGNRLVFDGVLPERYSAFLQVTLRSEFLGWFRDPHVDIAGARQDFERGAQGVRYLNLSGFGAQLHEGLALNPQYCRLVEEAVLWVFPVPETDGPVLVLAPHADDAELAAFSVCQSASDVSLVTVSQGEISAQYYQRLGLDREAAARLKGRLRSWNSLSIPLWSGIPASNCWQLGYYCLQLAAMQREPELGLPSLESGEADIRSVRQHNPTRLPGDDDGHSSWRNLVAALTALLESIKPAVVVTPHPELDPHPDHIAVTQALQEALSQSHWQPKQLWLYANHLHDNDRWPMGPEGGGVALPPAYGTLPVDALYSRELSRAQQIDKAMALAMQHDLKLPLPLKQRIRRCIQRCLVGRRWPVTGEDEFFRKAVRSQEIFWVRELR